ncbi:hypothetical protein ACHQM5_022693 [Ranunculus cassubicifolius]
MIEPKSLMFLSEDLDADECNFNGMFSHHHLLPARGLMLTVGTGAVPSLDFKVLKHLILLTTLSSKDSSSSLDWNATC